MSELETWQIERWLDMSSWFGSTDRAATALQAFAPLCREILALRKQADLDRQSREASQREFARLNRELNEARALIQIRWDERNAIIAERNGLRETAEDARIKIGVLLHEVAHTAIARGMMREDAPPLDGPNAILFLQMMRES